MPRGGGNKNLRVLGAGSGPPKDEQVPKEIMGFKPPRGLSSEARKFWNRHIPQLEEFGKIMESDLDSFRVLCELHAQIMDCYKTLKAEGLIVQGAGNTKKKHPATSILNSLLQQYRLLSVEFGLTPAGRERLGITTQTLEDLEDDEFLYGPH